jgi:outer membrane protein OmpA-like peptidoglycan-associated protein/tetratricopeptide (TPR) repeat protein
MNTKYNFTMKHHALNKTAIGIVFFALLVIQPIGLNARTQSADKNSIALSKAKLYYKTRNYSQAAICFEEHLQKDSVASAVVLGELADCYWNMRRYDNALKVYKRLYPNGSEGATNRDKIRIGELYARTGAYNLASDWLNGVSTYAKKAGVYSQKSKIQAMKKDSFAWKTRLLNIDTQYREFSPLVADGSLFFSSNKPLVAKSNASGWDGRNYLHLWCMPLSGVDTLSTELAKDSLIQQVSTTAKGKKIADVYECGDTKSNANINRAIVRKLYLNGDAQPVGALVDGFGNIKFNAGNIAIDKNKHIYFSSNYEKADKNNVNRIRLMEADYSNGNVCSIKALPFGDANSYSVMHPAVNADGTILVFSSDKPNGSGGYDLYYAERADANQKWSEMKTLGDKLNTGGNEVFPTITADGNLYFSSDALPGLGGLDLYKLQLADAISGSAGPVHLTYPINSTADDFSWTQKDSLGRKGYFTSDRLNNDDNIYSLTYVAPNGKYSLRGRVLDDITKYPIKNATVFLYNKQSDKVYVTKTDANGNYTFPVSKSADVVIKAVEKDHSNNCLTKMFEVKPLYKDSVIAPHDLLLGRFKVGYKWKLDNIHYDYNKYNIRADARPILDSVLRVLNTYPIKVELSSHTDARGKTAYNDRLSQHRADAAVAYLIQNGIDPLRITAKGYGERQLLNKCADGVKCSEEEHQANRRTEVKVTGLTEEGTNLEIDPDKFNDGQELEKSALPNGFFDKCK